MKFSELPLWVVKSMQHKQRIWIILKAKSVSYIELLTLLFTYSWKIWFRNHTAAAVDDDEVIDKFPANFQLKIAFLISLLLACWCPGTWWKYFFLFGINLHVDKVLWYFCWLLSSMSLLHSILCALYHNWNISLFLKSWNFCKMSNVLKRADFYFS